VYTRYDALQTAAMSIEEKYYWTHNKKNRPTASALKWTMRERKRIIIFCLRSCYLQNQSDRAIVFARSREKTKTRAGNGVCWLGAFWEREEGKLEESCIVIGFIRYGGEDK